MWHSVKTKHLRNQTLRVEKPKLQVGDAENYALWRQFIDVSMAEFNKVYDRLGVVFDETLGESAYNAVLPGVVDGLLKSGIASKSDGAIVVAFPKDAESKRLSDTVLVIRKKDGASLRNHRSRDSRTSHGDLVTR